MGVHGAAALRWNRSVQTSARRPGDSGHRPDGNAQRLDAGRKPVQFLDKITLLAVQQLQLSASADLARVVFPNTGLETWRMSLLAQSNVARLTSVQLPDVSPALLGVLAARTDAAAGLSQRLAVNFPGRTLERATAQTARAWVRYTALRPTAHRLEMSAAAGSTVSVIIGSDLLLVTEDDDAEELAADIDAQVAAPWHNGTIAARTDLLAALRAIDPTIAAFLTRRLGGRRAQRRRRSLQDCALRRGGPRPGPGHQARSPGGHGDDRADTARDR